MSYRVRHVTEYMYGDGGVDLASRAAPAAARDARARSCQRRDADGDARAGGAPRSRRLVRQPCRPTSRSTRGTRASPSRPSFIVDIAREPPPEDDGPWEAARDWVRAAADAEARAEIEMALPSPRVVAVGGGARVRRAVVHAGAAAGRGGARADAPDPRRVHLRPEGDRRRHAGRRGPARPPRRLPGLRPRPARLPARVRPRRPLRQRLPGHAPCRRADEEPSLVGADASHAWVSVRLPGGAWLDLDPTNDVVPTDRHIVVAVGRDFGDVTPMRGVLLGGGRHELIVGVSVTPT